MALSHCFHSIRPTLEMNCNLAFDLSRNTFSAQDLKRRFSALFFTSHSPVDSFLKSKFLFRRLSKADVTSNDFKKSIEFSGSMSFSHRKRDPFRIHCKENISIDSVNGLSQTSGLLKNQMNGRLETECEPAGESASILDAEDSFVPEWTDSIWASNIDFKRRIFCNRSMNMRSIMAVGFDMDYTLAQYRPDTFESMAYEETIKKLVYNLGYPKELLNWTFDWKYMVRGLVLDKKRGNILKLDRHKYVKVAYHGFREMSREERREIYCNTLVRESFDEPDFALIDTLFSLAEAYLFAQLVDFHDFHPGVLPDRSMSFCESCVVKDPDYSHIYRNVREAVDLCHRDGSLKTKVAKNPAHYIYQDTKIVPMLKLLRKSGKITFLVTNSLWDYTNVVMNYLFGNCGTTKEKERNYEWLSLFDIVITGSAKPSFFIEGKGSQIFEVETSTGKLMNTDSGSPLPNIEKFDYVEEPTIISQGCKVYQGGTVSHLHKMLGIQAGSQVLYVGDHIYGDILRSKKHMGWRTMLVVPELQHEILCLRNTQKFRKEFHSFRQQRDAFDDTLQRLQWVLKFEILDEQQKSEMEEQIQSLREHRNEAREKHRKVMKDWHISFHRVWGQLMRTGYQNSRFAHQVERFACLYTSHVGNLLYYSPEKSFRTSEDFTPHELDIIDL